MELGVSRLEQCFEGRMLASPLQNDNVTSPLLSHIGALETPTQVVCLPEVWCTLRSLGNARRDSSRYRDNRQKVKQAPNTLT